MTEKIIISGAGGQGIMLLGKVLSESAMREGKFVTWFPAYGAEVRGGTAYCMVIVSTEEISSPYVDKADVLIIMNRPSLDRFKSRLKKRGVMILNKSLTGGYADKNVKVAAYPFTEIAASLKNIKTANMIALGYLIKERKFIEFKTVVKVMSEMAPQKELLEINKKALREGASLNDESAFCAFADR